MRRSLSSAVCALRGETGGEAALGALGLCGAVALETGAARCSTPVVRVVSTPVVGSFLMTVWASLQTSVSYTHLTLPTSDLV